jgi:hypothetical protein
MSLCRKQKHTAYLWEKLKTLVDSQLVVKPTFQMDSQHGFSTCSEMYFLNGFSTWIILNIYKIGFSTFTTDSGPAGGPVGG